MPKKWQMTRTEARLKRERMMAAFISGRDALDTLRMPHFLAYGAALGALRQGEFQPSDDNVNVGIYQWDLAALQRRCPDPSGVERDNKMRRCFEQHGFEPVSEVLQDHRTDEEGISASACPRSFLAEGWSEEDAFPILYKFMHKECFVRFNVTVFTAQFGMLWDFADGGAETSSGWKYVPFAPQPVEFEKVMTFTMPPSALEEHYGPDWHVPRSANYIESLSMCWNRCQVLRVYPFDVDAGPKPLPEAVPWDLFRKEVRSYRMKYAKAMIDTQHELPPKELDLHSIESRPMVLFQAAGICKFEGNLHMKTNAERAMDRYEEGLYILDKVADILTSWRLIFRRMHDEKAEEDRKTRGLKCSDLVEASAPTEFSSDVSEARNLRVTLLLNASQAALQLQHWEVAEARAGQAMELEPSVKAHYRRGLARARLKRDDGAKADFVAMLKLSKFQSKEAMFQLHKLCGSDVKQHLKEMKNAFEKSERMSELITTMDEDERVAIQDERYARFTSDCEQRKADSQKEITFDEWVLQYEWRYDAEERQKTRAQWPFFFSHLGPAPLPVEDWEVDYLTHKEIEKIIYRRQTAALGAKRLEKEPRPEAVKEGFHCKLQLDDEDKDIFNEGVLQKGYNYWW